MHIGAAFALAGFVMAGIDLVGVGARDSWVDTDPQLWWFGPRLVLALPLLAGALAWVCASLMQRLRPPRLVLEVACALPLLLCVPPLFAGAAIAASPLRVPLLIAALVLTLAGVWALRAGCLQALARLPRAGLARQLASVAALLGALASPALVATVSAEVLHGLYPSFHIALLWLALGSSAACWLVVLAVAWPGRPSARASSRRALVPAGIALAAWLATLDPCLNAASGRNTLIERAPFAGALVPFMFELDLASASLYQTASHPRPLRASNAGVPLSSASFDRPARPHVLLVTVDALRGDVLHDGTPFSSCAPGLRALAQRNRFFERAYAPSNATLRSVPALLTGLAHAEVDAPREAFLPAILARNGYDNAAWVTKHDKAVVDNELTRLRDLGFYFAAYQDAYVAADEVLRWGLDKLRGERPRFVWLHLSDVHAPYALPGGLPPASCTATDEYGARLSLVDVALSRFFAQLEARSDVVWALSSDHGESRGEHGVMGHASNLFEEQIRVPLVLGGAGVERAAIAQPISTLDLPATLLVMAGARLASGTPVLALRGTLPGPSARPAISYTDTACAIIEDRFKLLADARAGTLLMFDLDDPSERTNVAALHAARAHTLFGKLAPPLCPHAISRLSFLVPR
jgi:hypothetical protein